MATRKRRDAGTLDLFAPPPITPAQADPLRALLADGRWHPFEEVVAAAGGHGELYRRTTWGESPRREGDDRLPVAVRLASPGHPEYAAWDGEAAVTWRAQRGL